MSGAGQISGQHGFQSGRIHADYQTSPLYLYAVEPGEPTEWRLLSGSKTPLKWPSGHQAIEARDGTQRIAISVDNDVKGGTPSNYPVHPNAKKAVEAVLDAMRSQNTTPPITSININSTVRAKTSKSSAHPDGRSVDINRINGKPVRCAHPNFATNAEYGCTALMDNKKSVADNMQTWVVELQSELWNDCRVEQVLGPLINLNKDGSKAPQWLEKQHRDHIHIEVYPTGEDQCG